MTTQQFDQNELSDLIKDLDLSKEAAELLASRLGEKDLLSHGTKITFYRTREKEFLPFFSDDEKGVFCQDVENLLLKLGLPQYSPDDWRLFIDSSKQSLKCMLLHNGNKYASIPIAHSTKLKEVYETIAFVIEKIKYHQHEWLVCVDLKMVNFLLGQQGGYTKFPCFLCLWDSRAKNEHWIKKKWPKREDMTVRSKNIINPPLIARERIILPPLHIKLGLMKQFVKAIDHDGPIAQKMPGLSTEKLNPGIFDRPQIRQFMKDPNFTTVMNELELKAWTSFVLVVENFLGNYRDANYKRLVENMLECFKNLGCNTSIKVHFLHSHLDWFPENLGDMSEEQGERSHQDMRTMEERYQGRWDAHMMADYCWSLQRDSLEKCHARKSHKRSFMQ